MLFLNAMLFSITIRNFYMNNILKDLPFTNYCHRPSCVPPHLSGNGNNESGKYQKKTYE